MVESPYLELISFIKFSTGPNAKNKSRIQNDDNRFEECYSSKFVVCTMQSISWHWH